MCDPRFVRANFFGNLTNTVACRNFLESLGVEPLRPLPASSHHRDVKAPNCFDFVMNTNVQQEHLPY